jgi:NDP-sugar pyrophosphorylase family protein
MRAMILAAGRGERARPLTDTIPKPLFPVAGRPLIAYALGLLKAAGIVEVVVNVQHLADMIVDQLEGCSRLGMDIAISREEVRLETGGGIANARSLLGDEPFVVVNSDVICDVDLVSVIDSHRLGGAVSTMVLRQNPDPILTPVVEYEPSSGRVLDLRGQLAAKSGTSRAMMFTGIYVLDPTVFDYVEPTPMSIVDAFYLPALREGRHVHGYSFDGYWADLGSVASYEEVARTLDPSSFDHFAPLPLAPVSMPPTPPGPPVTG